jgi:hypothetical protein
VNDEPLFDLEQRHARRMQQVTAVAQMRATAHAHKSFNEYRKERYEQLRTFVANRRKIYLDTKFWIWLRDPSASPNPAAVSALLGALQRGVAEGYLCCPVSYPIFLETTNIFPFARRGQHAATADTLCAGVALRNPFDVFELEVLDFFIRNSPSFRNLPLRRDSVWCPVGHLLGEKYPFHPMLDGPAQDAAQKFTLDAIWELTLADLVMHDVPRPFRDTAQRINAERVIYPRGSKSFQELFRDELHGGLEALLPHITKAMSDLASVFGIMPEAGNLTLEAFRPVINLIRESVTQQLDTGAIPSLRVRSALHAALRLDDRRPFRENDLSDIDHSAIAASYCDVLLTERSFGDLLRRPFVAEISRTQCASACDPEAALALLDRT